MNGADADRWSDVAHGWAELWGSFGEPAWRAVVDDAGIGPGARVLDAGCGTGDFLAYVQGLGAVACGTDPAPAMVELARTRAPGADVRSGSVDAVPWPDGSFDVVTSINALQFADDRRAALAELVRVVVPGGMVAVASWAEAAMNDIDSIEAAVAAADGDGLRPDPDYRLRGGLARVVAAGGLEVVRTGLVEVPWTVPDAATLVRGVLLGEDEATVTGTTDVVLDAAQPFRVDDSGYRLVNHFRYVVARTPDPDRP